MPFTDQQVTAALRESAAVIEQNNAWDADGRPPYQARKLRYLADRVERGGLNGAALREAVPHLVKVCAVCGKTALYRIGPEGRCRAHRDVSTAFRDEQRARLEARSAAIEEHNRNREHAALVTRWSQFLKRKGR